MEIYSFAFLRIFTSLFLLFLTQPVYPDLGTPNLTNPKGIEFLVNSTTDADDINPGDGICKSVNDVCTLRAAVTEANALSIESVINLPNGTFQFTTNPNREAHLMIYKNITIQGVSPRDTIIDGDYFPPTGTRLPVFSSYANLTLKRLSIINGYSYVTSPGGVTDPYEVYGAVTARKQITLDEVVLRNNTMGIYAMPITISGVPLTTPQILIYNSTIQDNGEGIFTNGIMIVDNSTISGNQNKGIEIVGGITTISNSTIVGNHTLGSDGGGIADWSGGNAIITMSHTILAGNFGPSPDCYGQINSAGYNLIGTIGLCNFITGQGDLINVEAFTSPLGDYGGLTPTIALLPNSPAIDAGNPAGCGKTVDQRGLSRPVDGNQDGVAVCDIGAYETQFTVYLPSVVK